MMKHIMVLLFCLPIFLVSCSEKKKTDLVGVVNYDELFSMKPGIENRLDTAIVGITDGTYPELNYKLLEQSLIDLDMAISKARSGYFLFQLEVDIYAQAAKSAIDDFEDSRVINLAPGTPAELYVNGAKSLGHIDFGSSVDYCGGPRFTVETWTKYSDKYIEFVFGSFISTFQSPAPYKGWTLHYWEISNTNLRFSIGTDHSNPDASLPTVYTKAPKFGEWFHVAAVFDSGAKKSLLYINGELKASTVIDENIVVNGPEDTRMWAFMEPKDNSRCMSGFIKNFRLWSTAKSESEIMQLKDSDVTGSESDLICAWDFTERVADDSVIPDKTGRHTAKLKGVFRWKATN